MLGDHWNFNFLKSNYYLLFSILIIRHINRIRKEELEGADHGPGSSPGDAPPYLVVVVQVGVVVEGHEGPEVFVVEKSG